MGLNEAAAWGLLVGWPPGSSPCRRRWSQPGSAGPAERPDGQPPGGEVIDGVDPA